MLDLFTVAIKKRTITSITIARLTISTDTTMMTILTEQYTGYLRPVCGPKYDTSLNSRLLSFELLKKNFGFDTVNLKIHQTRSSSISRVVSETS